MLSSGQQAADFLKVFHPILRASDLNTTIACCDGGGWEEARKQFVGLQEAGAEDTLEIASGHGYFSPPRVPFNTAKRVCKQFISHYFRSIAHTQSSYLNARGSQPI
jgi:hypothetical protein